MCGQLGIVNQMSCLNESSYLLWVSVSEFPMAFFHLKLYHHKKKLTTIYGSYSETIGKRWWMVFVFISGLEILLPAVSVTGTEQNILCWCLSVILSIQCQHEAVMLIKILTAHNCHNLTIPTRNGFGNILSPFIPLCSQRILYAAFCLQSYIL